MNPIHRDDVPFHVVEEIEKALHEAHPGLKVQFVGDTNDPEAIERAQKLHAKMVADGQLSLANGSCIDCGALMAGYEGQKTTGEIVPAQGWSHMIDQEKNFMGWLCPDCQDPGGRDEIRPVFLGGDDET